MKCRYCECIGEAQENGFCYTHNHFRNMVTENDKLKEKIRKRNLMIKQLREDIKHLDNENGYLKSEIAKLKNAE